MKKQITSHQSPVPIGPYSQAVKVNGVLYASGQIAIDANTGLLQVHSFEQEVLQVFYNIDAVLKEADLTKNNIVKVSIFLKNMNQFDDLNALYATYFKGVEVYPARETVEVSVLPKNVNVEMSFIAVN